MALKNTARKLPFGGLATSKILFAALLAASLLLFAVYVREGGEGPLHSAQNAAAAVASPLSAVGSTVGSLAVSATTSVEDLTASDASVAQLRENNARLAQMVVELEEYRQEAARLEAMIGLADAYGFESIACRVTGYSADSYNRIITLDVGANAGVHVGLPVMGSTGVVGQVISVTPLTSQVRLINDANSGISVLVQSSRAEGILTGSVDGTLYLEGVDDSVEIKEGEAVITSGLGGGYFRGLVVGTVSKIEQRQGNASRTIIVHPNATLSNISEALVVVGMSNEGAALADAAASKAMVDRVNPQTLTGGAGASASQTAAQGQSANGSDATSTDGAQDGAGSSQSDAAGNADASGSGGASDDAGSSGSDGESGTEGEE